jgi:hypothetical protein
MLCARVIFLNLLKFSANRSKTILLLLRFNPHSVASGEWPLIHVLLARRGTKRHAIGVLTYANTS